MFLIEFFLLNSNPMSASLKYSGIFFNSRSKVNFKVKYDLSTNEARKSVIPQLHVIVLSIFEVILII